MLSARLEAIIATARIGKAPQADLINARDELLIAELDLAPSHARQVELHRSRIENLKAGEEYLVLLQHQAKAGESDVLAAKSRRLLAEIELERLLASLNTEPKQ